MTLLKKFEDVIITLEKINKTKKKKKLTENFTEK